MGRSGPPLTRRPERDHVTIARAYCEQVIAGEIPACRWIRMACQRQLDDLAHPPAGYRFDDRAARRICKFVERMPHIKGRWSTSTIRLEPWQCWILTTIFGWVDDQGMRRYRKALVIIPRKNGKTILAACIALYLLALDKEPGAEIYAAARTRQQARVVWEVARDMVRKSKKFRSRFGVETHAHSISQIASSSYFKPLSRDAKSLEGTNPHGWVADEVHAHRTREVFDALNQGTGARSQPLGFIISTEGESQVGILPEQVHYGEQVLEGRHEDPTYFVAIYTIDKDDEWTAPLTWRKANPNLGVSVDEKELATLCAQATASAEAQSAFQTKRLNVRVGAHDAYFNMLAWRNLCLDSTLQLEDFAGEPCWIGVDLASKIDLACYVRGFQRGDDMIVFPRFYLPLEAIKEGKPNFDFYEGWQKKKLLQVIDGPKIKQADIEADLLADCDRFDVRGVGIDKWEGERMIENLVEEGVPAVEVPIRVNRVSLPMKEIQAGILSGEVKHDGNPVLAWCMANVVAKIDANENVFPRKARPENKIDGAVALILCKDQLMRDAGDGAVNVRGLA